MIVKKRAKIIFKTLIVVFLFAGFALAEGEWAANGDNIYNTNAGGNIGIGTTAPLSRLSVVAKTAGTPPIVAYGTNGKINARIGSWSGDYGALALRDALDNRKVLLHTGGISYLNGGNVGIGTTNPAAELEIRSDTSFIRDGQIIMDPGVEASPEAGPDVPNWIRSERYANSSWDLGLGGSIYSGGKPLVMIKKKGNVGIGTTSPDKRLHIAGAGQQEIRIEDTANNIETSLISGTTRGFVGTESSHNFSIITAGSSKVTIETSGNVGLGTADPDEKLDVKAGRIKTNMALNRDEDHHLLANDSGTIFGKIGLKYSSADFYIGTDTYPNLVLLDRSTGKVGIGTTNPKSKLSVNGMITAKEIKVESGWSDFVFEDTYELPSLNSVESYIKKHKHLPDIPSAKEVKEQGLAVSDMLAKQMQKIEELTLYIIGQNRKIKKLEEQMANLTGCDNSN